jgi:DNA-directed RNA polymerase II subunit RPB2
MVTSYRTISDTEKKGNMYTTEEICIPPMSSDKSVKQEEPGYFKRKCGNYSLLDKDGIVRKGVQVFKNDVLIGKVLIKSSKNGEEIKIDCSYTVKQGEEGIVDRRIITYTPQGYKMVKIVIRRDRNPEMGDKFCSRAAQKGTCGMIYNHEDMPFNIEGIVPDIIINSHCIKKW